jgi:putative transposase
MPRRPRVVFPGVAHHITQRGNNREPVFRSSGDRRFYLDLLVRHAARHGARILGYCLMTNHVHLIAVPDRGSSLARTLGCTHSEYALALNRTHGRSGHLWQNRFFSCPLGESHLLSALRYVELNPVRAGLASDPAGWPWSSARAHTVDRAADPVLNCRWVEYFGRWDYGEWREILSAGASGGEGDSIRRATYVGEPLGPQEFIAALEQQVGRRLRVMARGRPPRKPEAVERPGRQGSLFVGLG